MPITYPPELLPIPDPDDEVEVIAGGKVVFKRSPPMPSDVERVARVLCWHNGIAECVDRCGSAEGCAYGMRDFGDVARAVVAALATRPSPMPSEVCPHCGFPLACLKCGAALAASEPATGVMASAKEAAERVARWSPAKRDYTRRVIGGATPQAGEE